MKKLITIIILSIIATFNAIYLTVIAYSINNWTVVFWGLNSSICDINNTFSCSSVFSNSFAWFFWIPFSLIATFVYPTIIIISLLWIFQKIKNPFKFLLIIWVCWIFFNGYIIFNEYTIWAYCLLCLICTFILLLILTLSTFWLIDYKKN